MSRISKSLSKRHNTKTFIGLECSVRTWKILVSQYGPRTCSLTLYNISRNTSNFVHKVPLLYPSLSPHPSFLPLQKPNADGSFPSAFCFNNCGTIGGVKLASRRFSRERHKGVEISARETVHAGHKIVLSYKVS